LQALEEAFEEVERERYKEITERFRKKIGKNIIDFTAMHIEAKMVELGLEEDLYIEKSKQFMRRRKKVAERRRSSGSSKDGAKNKDRQTSCSDAPPFTPDQADEILDQIGNNNNNNAFGVMHIDPLDSEDESHSGVSAGDDDGLSALGVHPGLQHLDDQDSKMDALMGLASPFNPHQQSFFAQADLAASS
jgi:hypothetical protein